MAKEKSEIEPEASDRTDGEHDIKQDDIKPDSESLTLDETVGCGNATDTTEGRKEEGNFKKMSSSATAAEGTADEDVSSKDDDKDPAAETHEAAVPLDLELEQKNEDIPSPKKMTVGSMKSRSDIAGLADG
jgi:hypothetical protein